MTIGRWIAILALAGILDSCGGGGAPAPREPGSRSAGGDGKALNLYIWSDYLGKDTLSNFEKQTGIKVHVAYYDTNDTLETKLLAGNSGFDVVVPTSSYFQRLIKAGVFTSLDKSRLPNLRNLDAQLMQRLASFDADNNHGIIYTWGTVGIGYNEKMVRSLLPDASLDSWRLLFDPAIASKLAKCGISIFDTPTDVLRVAYMYMGKDANSQSPEDLTQAEVMLKKIRPFIRNFYSAEYIEALANGDLCVSMGYNGDVLQARDRARDAQTGVEIKYTVPKEGSILWFDTMAIPKDAPNPDSAYQFLNYIMLPQVIAGISNTIRYANGNAAASSALKDDVKGDPMIYPPQDVRLRLSLELTDTPEHTRAAMRMWQKLKSGE
jgi:putrescine transport system substrate-binding protein